MRIAYYQVNAFTKNPFGGNPAGVCPLERWLPDDLLQRIAAENNLSETAFFVRTGEQIHLRWMTPTVEVDLCGHATLATAAVLFFELRHQGERIEFQTRSGLVAAARRGDLVELDFPAWPSNPCADDLEGALGRKPKHVFAGSRDYLAVFETEEEVRELAPNMVALSKLDRDGVIATARGADADFVSRFFAPRLGVPEDPVTGSAHCSLIPYWAERLGKTGLLARQISKRGGELFCRLNGNRVAIGGNAVIYERGEIEIAG
jgi:PhzF family phenazine biosynthesis protein